MSAPYDRPARNPSGVECSRCRCVFIGEEWHQFCGVCINVAAQEIAAVQGQVVVTAPASDGSGKDGGGL